MDFLKETFTKYAGTDDDKGTMSKKELADLLRQQLDEVRKSDVVPENTADASSFAFDFLFIRKMTNDRRIISKKWMTTEIPRSPLRSTCNTSPTCMNGSRTCLL